MNKHDSPTWEFILLIAWCISAILSCTLYRLTDSDYRKLDKRVVALEQAMARQECEKEAVSVGAGYVFIANGTESECYPLYSE